jgi:hypothetical protein
MIIKLNINQISGRMFEIVIMSYKLNQNKL